MDSSPPTTAPRKTVDGKTVDVPVPAEYVVDTHVRMHQAQTESDPSEPGIWEIAFANGGYHVRVVLGDPDRALPQNHSILVEGTELADASWGVQRCSSGTMEAPKLARRFRGGESAAKLPNRCLRAGQVGSLQGDSSVRPLRPAIELRQGWNEFRARVISGRLGNSSWMRIGDPGDFRISLSGTGIEAKE